MDTDALVLQALADGAASAAAIAAATGLGERRCYRSLDRQKVLGRVWSPVYGSYQLTRSGRDLVADLATPRREAAIVATTRPARTFSDKLWWTLPDGTKVPDDGLSHVIGPRPLVEPGSMVATERTNTPLVASAGRPQVEPTKPVGQPSAPRSSTAPWPAPMGDATSDNRRLFGRTAHDDGEMTMAAEAGTIGRGTVAAWALVIGGVGAAHWKGQAVVEAVVAAAEKGQAVLAALGAARTATSEAPREKGFQPAPGMASTAEMGYGSDLMGYRSGMGW
ncbi:MAG: hypothetical protein IVW53_14710 [Chloroflexi bacterium]|nr:hypothetical protein [Chloroflexota bacterium]